MSMDSGASEGFQPPAMEGGAPTTEAPSFQQESDAPEVTEAATATMEQGLQVDQPEQTLTALGSEQFFDYFGQHTGEINNIPADYQEQPVEAQGDAGQIDTTEEVQEPSDNATTENDSAQQQDEVVTEAEVPEVAEPEPAPETQEGQEKEPQTPEAANNEAQKLTDQSNSYREAALGVRQQIVDLRKQEADLRREGKQGEADTLKAKADALESTAKEMEAKADQLGQQAEARRADQGKTEQTPKKEATSREDEFRNRVNELHELYNKLSPQEIKNLIESGHVIPRDQVEQAKKEGIYDKMNWIMIIIAGIINPALGVAAFAMERAKVLGEKKKKDQEKQKQPAQNNENQGEQKKPEQLSKQQEANIDNRTQSAAAFTPAQATVSRGAAPSVGQKAA